ncbi:MAG: ABC transporter substrate-binding protein [SAR202 cluster bacterium]|nr:ABC transporter substrate-binding protein [SAR202 cluster bacterium]
MQPRLRVAVPPPGEQFTVPYTQTQTSEKIMPSYEHLVGRDIRTNVEVPQLASKWAVAANGKDWTFDLRQGVPFYRDGKAFNNYTFSARDVVLTWDLLNGEEGAVKTSKAKSPGEWNNRLGSGAGNWEVVNDNRVILHSPKVWLDAAFFFSDEWESGIVSKQHWDAVGGEDGYMANPIGNGPWSYVSHSANQNFLHKAVKGHYRQTPEFDELQILFVQEAATRLAQLLAKEVDIIPLLRSQRQQVETSGFKTVKSTLPGLHSSLQIMYYRQNAYCVNGTPLPGAGAPCGPSKAYDVNDPTRKPAVRRALNLAINRDEINKVFFDGKAFPAVSYFPPWRDDWKDEWAPIPGPEGKTGKDGGYPYPYDPAAASKLLADSGVPDGFEITLTCFRVHQTVPEWPDMCERFVQHFNAIKVRSKLEFVNSFGEFRTVARARERSQWLRTAAESLDPICAAVAFAHVWELGIGYMEHEPISDFWKKCNEIASLDERRKLASDLGTLWLKESYSVPLLWIFGEAAINQSVVEDYAVNQLHMGPIRYHEYTKAVQKR